MDTSPLVLAVDDESWTLRRLKLELGERGFQVVTAGSGQEGLAIAEERRPDIVLLDIVIPDMAGLEVLRTLRKRSPAPVIILTAKNGDADKVRGLEQGADDYMVKPFCADELGARIRAVLRRSNGSRERRRLFRAGALEIDLERRIVTQDGETVGLTRTEWLVLLQLASNSGKVMTYAEMLSKVWGGEYASDVQYLRVWVSRLRRKVEADPTRPAIIKTMQGVGYMLDAEPSEAVATG